DVAPPVAWMWAGAVIVALIAMSELAPFRGGRAGRASGTGLSGALRATVAAGIALTLIVAAPAFGALSDQGLEIFAIDVGQGDALAIRTPERHWILVDTGPRNNDFDAGRSRVVPFLRAHGASRIEVLILTHPHADHIGGAQAV